ncbi:MAG: hypothetical protein IJ094_06250 [Bacilli bacterium]|nr:hypothetical protein [Bacilli bacterium]
MVKKNWSNPELKELSIENTLEVKYKCDTCGDTRYGVGSLGKACRTANIINGEYVMCTGTIIEIEEGTGFIS